MNIFMNKFISKKNVENNTYDGSRILSEIQRTNILLYLVLPKL